MAAGPARGHVHFADSTAGLQAWARPISRDRERAARSATAATSRRDSAAADAATAADLTMRAFRRLFAPWTHAETPAHSPKINECWPARTPFDNPDRLIGTIRVDDAARMRIVCLNLSPDS
jgi:hypothetical protein